MEMEKKHLSIRRGTSWNPGELRKPLQAATQDMHTPETDCNASWEKRGFNKDEVISKTNLCRSASLSEKELKEARIRSQIIAAQLTVPSNSNSSSRGVQLFNRRKQRVNAFTLESSGEGSVREGAENVKTDSSSNTLTWAERGSEENDRSQNCKNSATKPTLSAPGEADTAGEIMEETAEYFHKEDVIEDSITQERHFLPVKEIEEEEAEEAKDTIHVEFEGKVKGEVGVNVVHSPAGNLLNGCHSSSGLERVALSTSKQTTINRTARPFFFSPTVQSPKAGSPVMDIAPPPTYTTPSLPPFPAHQPVALSPPPPPPSYPTPPLPVFTNRSLHTYSSPPPASPVMSLSSPPPPHFPPAASQHGHTNPPMPHYGPPTAPKPSTFVPQSMGERKPMVSIKTGILEEGVTRRAHKKSMFTFKEKPVIAPNPELLSLVQGVDERKKHGQRPVPEPTSEEELLALGAEASNFLTKNEDKAEEVRTPEWSSCLKSSTTRPREEHKPDQSLTNASGKGAELFAKRQSRMEKYILENQNPGQIRSPSPTMSLPPSWVYPSNMPGRVKAIAKNSDMTAQLSQNINAQQAVKRKPTKKAPPPEPVPEPTPLENGCTKIEMDLSRHRPYQLNSSLFILNPVKDPLSSLPRGAPQPKNLIPTQSHSRLSSLPNSPLPQFTGGAEYPSDYRVTPMSGPPVISSATSSFSPERVSSPRSGVQAPRPTFSTKKAGIEPQTTKESSLCETPRESPTPIKTTSFMRCFSSPESPTVVTWSPTLQTNTSSSSTSISRYPLMSSVSPPDRTTCQSPMANQKNQYPTVSSVSILQTNQASTTNSPLSPMINHKTRGSTISSSSNSKTSQTSATTTVSPSWSQSQNNQSTTIVSSYTFRPSQASTASSSRSPWSTRCQSPVVCQNSQSPTISSTLASRPSTTTVSTSPPWSTRCQSPTVSLNTQSFSVISNTTPRPSQISTTNSSRTSPWGSRCQSPVMSPNIRSSTNLSNSISRASQTFTSSSSRSSPWGSRCQSPLVHQNFQFSTVISTSTSRATNTSTVTSPVSPPWGSRCQSPALSQNSLSYPVTKTLNIPITVSPVSPSRERECMSPIVTNLDSKANHRLLAKNIINAAKRKNSPSPGALSGHSLPISPLGYSPNSSDSHKPPISSFHSRSLRTHSPVFTSPPPTPANRICSPVRFYNTRSLTDSDASIESEDSGLRSPSLHSYNTCPRGWGGSLRVKRSTVSTDL
ncbi:synaptopodin isoform X2 [Thalassophryne amazonica]|uniref:synaptopodin isoform X2 n=1 Tax=Thalassophryne amazonica TaxID=390379 RepID=UPI001472508F|nr:synaptopodin isoform X2 [Thalassophryne amazonica]